MKKLLFIIVLLASTFWAQAQSVYEAAPTGTGWTTVSINQNKLNTTTGQFMFYMAGQGWKSQVSMKQLKIKLDSIKHVNDSLRNIINTSLAGKQPAGSYRTMTDHDSLGHLDERNYSSLMGLPSLVTNNQNTILGLNAGYSLTTGYQNTLLGFSTGYSLTTQVKNTFVGDNAGVATVADKNAFMGSASGQSNTSGQQNTFLGYFSGGFNTDGAYNVFLGSNAGAYYGSGTVNQHPNNSVMIGYQAYSLGASQTNQIVIGYQTTGHGSNTATWGNTSITDHYFSGNIRGGAFIKTGGTNGQFLKADGSSDATAYVPYTGAVNGVNLGAYDLTVQGITVGKGGSSIYSNTVVGNSALSTNVTGYENTGMGLYALTVNTTGSRNVANGYATLYSNTTGWDNTAIGDGSLWGNTTGSQNTGIGMQALANNTTGVYNIAIGVGSGGNTTTGTNIQCGHSLFIGYNAKALAIGGDNEIVIGDQAIGHGSNTATWGNTSITDHYFTGAVRGGAFIKTGGTRNQQLNADGSSTSGPTVVTTAYTVISTDDIVICNSATDFTTVTLPASVSANRKIIIKNIGTGFIDVYVTGGGYIDSDTTYRLYQWDSITVLDNSGKYLIL